MKLINRHIAKTISWRILGTLDTMFLSWLITGDLKAGMQIGLADIVIKMILYYLHERAWFKSSVTNSNKRHFLKTITWRIIGTVSTIILSFWIWGDSAQSFQIGGAETLTKTILYYFHEKFWYRLSFGLKNKRENL
tara:strand:+ start:98 stop:505 length:408 start_codon:yes stop_codon:yes gene_type:complete